MDNDALYETDDNKKKFQLTRGMLILAAVILVVIIIVIIIIVHSVKSKEPEYTTSDFKHLEDRMEEEAPTYISQNNIELTSEEIKIDLKDLLLENGGSIDSSKVKATKVCKGYVIAAKVDSEVYKPYISCGNYYTTEGYVNSDTTIKKKTTSKKDTEKPVITLKGNSEITLNQGDKYNDEGARATDNIDGDITSKIKVSGKVDITKSGTYTITYTVTDKAGNRTEVTRKVTVVATITTTMSTTKKKTTTKKSYTSSGSVKTTRATTQRITTPPTIALRGSSTITINQGASWHDPGFTAKDAKGNDLTGRVNVSGYVNISVAGTYRVSYTVTDNWGNRGYAYRNVIVKSTYIKLQAITVSPVSLSLSKGQSRSVTVYFNPTNATNKSVSWSSSDPSVATVSNGVITANSQGIATIIVKGADGRQAQVSVTVR